MESDIVLYGASGHCKVIIELILSSDKFKINSIIDDNENTKNVFNYDVKHSKHFEFKQDLNYFISIGNNRVRKNIANRLNVNFQVLIHPYSRVSPLEVIIGKGSVVMVGAIINPFVRIGEHCIINSGAIVEHDCKIGNFVHICPGANLAGGVEVGEGTMIGIGAVIIQGIKIGKWAIIGAGAVIANDIPDYAMVVGVPGKIIKYLKNEN